MKKPRVSILIVNWNGEEIIERAIDSILKQDYPNFEIIIVDNNSEDRSVDIIEDKYPDVKLFTLDKNTGFARGNNYGFKRISGKYLLTLNNDIELKNTSFITNLIEVIVKDPKIGSVAPKLLYYYQKDKINTAGIELLCNGNAKNRGKGLNFNELNNKTEIFGACAGAALYRKSAIDELSFFFDESYEAYLEDVDLAWRLQLEGYKCIYQPKSVAYHIHSYSYKRFSKKKLYNIIRNSLRNLIKYYPLKNILIEPLYSFVLFFKMKASKNKRIDISFLDLVILNIKARISIVIDLLQKLLERRKLLRSSIRNNKAIIQKYESKNL